MTPVRVAAWLFVSISYFDAEEWASREEVERAADSIMHAVPEDTEFDSAVPFLADRGLLEVQDGMFRLTAAGRALAERCSAHYLDTTLDRVTAALSSMQTV